MTFGWLELLVVGLLLSPYVWIIFQTAHPWRNLALTVAVLAVGGWVINGMTADAFLALVGLGVAALVGSVAYAHSHGDAK